MPLSKRFLFAEKLIKGLNKKTAKKTKKYRLKNNKILMTH